MDSTEEQNTKHIVKNFALEEDQAEWLRVYAFEQRRTQADVVREALDAYRKKAERKGR